MRKRYESVLENKVFSKDNILLLGRELYDIYKQDRPKPVSMHLTIAVKCSGGEKYEVENTNIQLSNDLNKLFDTKKIMNINMSYRNYLQKRSVEIDITQGGGSWVNTLRVDGEDEPWVNDTYTRIQDILKSIKPQNSIYARLRKVICHVVAINSGWLFWHFVILLLNQLGYKNQATPSQDAFSFLLGHLIEKYLIFKFAFLVFIFWATGLFILMWFWYKIDAWLLSLWPSVEFDFGPNHLRRQKNTRKTLSAVILLIIIPPLLQFVVSILT